ncbi:MAG: hypothetical protein R3190_04130 [Thermoanaerobaculia bacterium]|nr:hypothetical protein [Thermoanaerobaculia bacterium]
MVTFLSLFLSLTVGVHEVRLGVDAGVAEVRVFLDGEAVGRVAAEPWVVEVDFGLRLMPHELVAEAFDARGRRVSRASQLVNLPREPAEASLSLVGGADVGYSAVEVAWQAADASDPEAVLLYFDGEPLTVAAAAAGARTGRRAALPAHDVGRIHIVTAELVFPRQQRAHAEIVFGGQYGEEVSTELTAVPLQSRRGGGRYALEELEAWLRVDGRPARVVAREEGRAEVIVVRDEASFGPLVRIGRSTGALRSRGSGPMRLGFARGLGEKDSLRFVASRPVLVEGSGGELVKLFQATPNLRRRGEGLGWATTHQFLERGASPEAEEIAAAVAVAGLQASASNRARAVILISAGEAAAGDLEPENVRSFLEVLHVPFYYWRVEARLPQDPWGRSSPVYGREQLNQAIARLRRDLDRQFVVWLDGIHMPQRIELVGAGVDRLGFAGGR